jgi:hypothetical protein
MRPHPRECRQETASLPVVSRPVAWLGMLSRCPRCHPNHNISAGGDLFKIAHPGRDLRRIGGRPVPEIRRPSSASPAATSPRQSASLFSSPMETWRAGAASPNVRRTVSGFLEIPTLVNFIQTNFRKRSMLNKAGRCIAPSTTYPVARPPGAIIAVPGIAWRRSTLVEGKCHARSWSGCCPVQGDSEVGELGVRSGLASRPALVFGADEIGPFVTENRRIQCPRSIHCTCKGKLIADGFSDRKKPPPFVRAAS